MPKDALMAGREGNCPVRVAAIGCGYWGKNLVRNFAELGALAAICDPDRNAARQLVSHRHVQVNGRNVNVASFNVKAGDEIAIKDKPKSRQLALRNLELTQIVPVPDWLTVDRDALKGKVAHIPSREEMQPIVNEQLIVELYSR